MTKATLPFLFCALLLVGGCDYLNDVLYPDFRAKEMKTAVAPPPFARDKIVIEKMEQDDQSLVVANVEPNPAPMVGGTIALDEIFDPVDGDGTSTPAASVASNNSNTPFATPPSAASPVSAKVASAAVSYPPPSAVAGMANAKDLPAIAPAADKIDDGKYSAINTRVQNIAKTLDQMSPAMVRMKGIEDDLEHLSLQLQALLIDKKTAPIAVSDALHKITNIRIGNHADKTRIVIEADHKISYDAALVASGALLSTRFAQASLSVVPQNVKLSGAVKSIKPTAHQGSTVLDFSLIPSGQSLKKSYIAPSPANRSHRIVLDIMK